jgi:membrane associated rhomboid family serine protease
VFGDNIEDRYGHLKFLIFYLGAGVVAVWAQVWVDPSSQIPMVGASGAIAGVLGAYLLLFPRSKVDTLLTIGLIMHVRLPAMVLIGAWAVMQAFNGLGSLGISSAGSGVAYFAHIGGFVAGAIASLAYVGLTRPTGARPRSQKYWRDEPLDYDREPPTGS